MRKFCPLCPKYGKVTDVKMDQKDETSIIRKRPLTKQGESRLRVHFSILSIPSQKYWGKQKLSGFHVMKARSLEKITFPKHYAHYADKNVVGFEK